MFLDTEIDGKQYLICKRVSLIGDLWFNKARYVAFMNPEAMKTFLECTHDILEKMYREYLRANCATSFKLVIMESIKERKYCKLLADGEAI